MRIPISVPNMSLSSRVDDLERIGYGPQPSGHSARPVEDTPKPRGCRHLAIRRLAVATESKICNKIPQVTKEDCLTREIEGSQNSVQSTPNFITREQIPRQSSVAHLGR